MYTSKYDEGYQTASIKKSLYDYDLYDLHIAIPVATDRELLTCSVPGSGGAIVALPVA
jgi:hypothetical protein